MKRLKNLLVVVGVVLVALGAFIWIAAGRLVSPPRRPLQAYHREYLEHPAEHGIRIEHFDALDRQVPCLLVEPDAGYGPALRGAILRKQLGQRGYKLDAYGTMRGTLVMLHGRVGRKEDLLPVAERFAAAGFRCILPDLPSHGDSPLSRTHFGSSPFECSMAANVLKEAAARYHFQPDPAGIWGMSMGGSYAISAAADPGGEWRAMVLVCTFDTLSGVVTDELRHWCGPLAPLIASCVEVAAGCQHGTEPCEVQPIQKARAISIPTLVAHGDADPLIAMHRGHGLYDALASPDKKWIEVKGGTHLNILVTPMPLYAEMTSWYLDHMNHP